MKAARCGLDAKAPQFMRRRVEEEKPALLTPDATPLGGVPHWVRRSTAGGSESGDSTSTSTSEHVGRRSSNRLQTKSGTNGLPRSSAWSKVSKGSALKDSDGDGDSDGSTSCSQRVLRASSENRTRHHCSECGKFFLYGYLLLQHLSKHCETSTFDCNMCPQTFRTRSLLRWHLWGHRKEKTTECPLCFRVFKQPIFLESHLQNRNCLMWPPPEADKDSLKGFCCSFCFKKLKSRTAVRVHERLHTGETPYKCSVCLKAFRQHYQLKSHLWKHLELC